MKRIISIFCSLFLVISIFAQSTSSIKGQLIDKEVDKHLPYVTITVAQANAPTKVVKRLVTDDNGKFSVSLPKGNYAFTFQFMGKETLTKQVEVTDENKPVDLGELTMNDSSTMLNEVSVTAQKPLVSVDIDKITYSVKDDPEASTSNVLDLLRKVPLVTVDSEDNIQLKGSSSFKIYLNGKPSNMITNNPSQVLKAMPANSIKDIEVITDPGAKYDAEGVGGIINIITDKKVDDGYTGSVGADAGSYGSYGGNAYLTMKYGKFGFNGNGGYYNGQRPKAGTSYEREDFSPNPVNSLTQNGKSKSKYEGMYLSGGISFEPDTLNLFNASISRHVGNSSSNSNQDVLSSGARNYSYNSTSKSNHKYGGMELSADYQRNFKKKGEMLTLSYRYGWNPNNSGFETLFSDVTGSYFYPDGYRQKTENEAGGNEHTGQIDYVNPILKKHTIELGTKYIIRSNSSRSDNTYLDVANNVWKEDLSRKNDLDHDQNITSGYASYNFKQGKMGIRAGLRGEYTDQKIHFINANDTTVNTSFFDLVPSLAVTYQIGMTQNLRFGYNMRISRPGIWYLNPFVNDVDPNNISYGNPNLDATQSHSLSVNYGLFSQKFNFNTTLNYDFSRNAISSYSFVKNGVTNNTYANIGKNQNVGLNIYASWTPVEFLRANLNSSISYTDIQSTTNAELRNSGFSGMAFGGLTFTLPKDFRIVANGGLFMNRVQLQTTQSQVYFYSVSALKSFLNKKLDINISISNPFNENLVFKSTTKGNGFMQKSTNYFPMRELRLSVTYRFGDLKSSIKKVQRTITNDDVLSGESNQQTGDVPTGK